MKNKYSVLLAILVLISLVITPSVMAGAQSYTPPNPDLPVRGVNSGVPAGAERDSDGHWFIPANTSGVPTDKLSASLAGGGPDDYGYTWNDNVVLNWIDTTHSGDAGFTDNFNSTESISIALPFSFKFYENTYTQVNIVKYGYLGFSPDGYWSVQKNIPSTDEIHNIIAPYMTWIYMGASGWVHYASGGTSPNRYFVVEWHGVAGGLASDSLGGDDTYNFEVILYENGDIVFQYQAMTFNGGFQCGTGGIEDSTGTVGLANINFCDKPQSNTAFRFYRPAPTGHVQVNPVNQGRFSSPGTLESFQLSIQNTGELGADVYDLIPASNWPFSIYAEDGSTLLTDTDSDGVIDTGSIAQGNTVSITVKIQTPSGAAGGSTNNASITARSSLNTAKSKTSTLDASVPVPFAQIYEDFHDSALSLDLVQPNIQIIKKFSTGANSLLFPEMALAGTPSGNLTYIWNVKNSSDSECMAHNEYTVVDHQGNTIHAVGKLPDSCEGTTQIMDRDPSIAVAPDGHIGVLWDRGLYDSETDQNNCNIYFATLDSVGNLLSGPTNITNNSIWFPSDYLPFFYDSPTITASDDNQFILSWKKISDFSKAHNIWYAVSDSTGSITYPPTAITVDGNGWDPVLNSLMGGKAILTWTDNNYVPSYAIVSSNGVIYKSAAIFNDHNIFSIIDAVQLSNGKVAVAWLNNAGIQFVILNSSYTVESGPFSANNPSLASGFGLSVTTDHSSHIIMTWQDRTTKQNLFYALGDSTGAFIAPPMVYKHSDATFEISLNGQGNTPYSSSQIFLPLTER